MKKKNKHLSVTLQRRFLSSKMKYAEFLSNKEVRKRYQKLFKY